MLSRSLQISIQYQSIEQHGSVSSFCILTEIGVVYVFNVIAEEERYVLICVPSFISFANRSCFYIFLLMVPYGAAVRTVWIFI